MAYLRRGFLKSAHRPNHLYCRIDSITLAAFAFVLLLIFMTAQPMVTPGVSFDLPAASHPRPAPAAMKWNAIKIGVSRDGSIIFGYSKVAPDDLPDKIRESVRNGAENKIYFKVDARAKYGDFAEILPKVHLAGTTNICFLVEQARPTGDKTLP